MIDLLGCRIGEQGVCLCRYGSGTEDQPDKQIDTLPERPEFPPPSLNLVPAFAADLPAKQGGDMLMVCAFLHSFGSLLGLSPVTMDDLLAAGIDAAHHLVCLSLCVCLSACCLYMHAVVAVVSHMVTSNLGFAASRQAQIQCMVAGAYDHCCALISDKRMQCLLAVVNGVQSQLLGEIHIALLRLLQMDLEEAHATGAIQASSPYLVCILLFLPWTMAACTTCASFVYCLHVR